MSALLNNLALVCLLAVGVWAYWKIACGIGWLLSDRDKPKAVKPEPCNHPEGVWYGSQTLELFGVDWLTCSICGETSLEKKR